MSKKQFVCKKAIEQLKEIIDGVLYYQSAGCGFSEMFAERQATSEISGKLTVLKVTGMPV